MSVDNLEVIDIVSINLSGHAVLTISDHLEWDDNSEHLLTLQNKVNAYLCAIEGGSLYENYPDATGRGIIINIIAKHEPNDQAKIFLKRVEEILKSTGYGFEFKVVPE